MGRRIGRKGPVQQWKCSICRHWGSEPQGPYHSIFPGFRYRLSSESLLKALALLVVGAPLNWIQNQLKIKSETLKKHFCRIVASERWEVLKTELERLGVPKRRLDQFDETVQESESCPDFFQSRGQEFRRLTAGERRKVARLASRILGREAHFPGSVCASGR